MGRALAVPIQTTPKIPQSNENSNHSPPQCNLTNMKLAFNMNANSIVSTQSLCNLAI